MSTETTNPILTRTYQPNYLSVSDSPILKMLAADYSALKTKFQAIFTALVAGATTVTLTVAQATAGVIETQTITSSAVPTGGQYFVNYGGSQSPAIQFDDNAAAVQAAIRQIPGLESVTVAGSFGTAFTVTFTGVAGNISNMTISGVSLIRDATATLSVAETTKGVIETQTITASATPASGTYVLNYGGHATAAIAWDANAAAVQAALRLVSGLSSVTVAGSFGTAFTVTFTGVSGDLALMTVTANSVQTVAPAAVTLTVAEGVKGVVEVQTVTSNHTPVSGQFKLSYGGNKTAFINFDAAASLIQTRLRAVAGLSLVTVTGSLSAGIVVTMTGVAGDATAITATDSTVVGDQAVTLAVAQGTAGVIETQTITPSSASVNYGSYVLNYGGYSTSPLQASATATDIRNALRAIPGLSRVTVAGSFATAFTVTFTGVAGNISNMTVTSSALYVLAAAGPVNAHSAEREFRRAALAYIYEGKGDAKHLADWALQSGNIDFTRSYSPA